MGCKYNIVELIMFSSIEFYCILLTTECFVISVPPKIYDISSDMTINEGTNVTLTCLATGKPEPSISWRHISPSGKAEIYQCCLNHCSLLFCNLDVQNLRVNLYFLHIFCEINRIRTFILNLYA